MKLIFENKFVKTFCFASHDERTRFIAYQKVDHALELVETFGEYYYCYVTYHSLTEEVQSIISFGSDEKSENLRLLHWTKNDIMVLDTGDRLFMIDNHLNIKGSFEITSPLMGLYLTDNLIVLEEVLFRSINSEGEILTTEAFDLIENVHIEGDVMHITTNEEIKTLKI